MPASIPVSTVPAVRAYLLAQLLTRPEMADPVLVCLDQPGTFEPDDIVCITDAQVELAVMQMVGTGGAGWLDERYTLPVVVDVYRGGDDAAATTNRAAQLAAVVVDVVRQDPQMAGAVNIAAQPTRISYESGFSDNGLGRNTAAVVEISVHARL